MRKVILVLLTAVVAFYVQAAGSSSSSTNKNKAQSVYNQGVKLMLDKNFVKAEAKFREALKKKKKWAEAHNNLAYTLRKQSPAHFDEALYHYNQAISLSKELPEPYMYRGVLHVQMGNPQLAQQDLNTLIALNSPLADELRFVMVQGSEKQPEQFFGVSR
jgi:Flp pilus assembly protein TadD